MSTKNQESRQPIGKGQATDPRTGRDEDDHIVVPPRTGSVYEEDADGVVAQPEQPHDTRAAGKNNHSPK